MTNRCILLAIVCCAAGCGVREPTWRSYEEIRIDEPTAAGALQWTTPSGWIEEPATGMRLAAFTVTRNGATGTCTLITLGGPAGGLEANVRRWMDQLGLDQPSDDELKAFLDRQERLGAGVIVVDLTDLTDTSDQAPSMLAAAVPVRDATLFVKFTGPRKLLTAEKDAFLELCRSVRGEP